MLGGFNFKGWFSFGRKLILSSHYCQNKELIRLKFKCRQPYLIMLIKKYRLKIIEVINRIGMLWLSFTRLFKSSIKWPSAIRIFRNLSSFKISFHALERKKSTFWLFSNSNRSTLSILFHQVSQEVFHPGNNLTNVIAVHHQETVIL